MPLDETITIDPARPLRMTADGMRAIKKATGRNMSELLQDDEDDANRLQVMAFAELYRHYARLGHLPDSASIWEEAGTLELEFSAPTVDPTSGESSTTSPLSAATGE